MNGWTFVCKSGRGERECYELNYLEGGSKVDQ